MPVFKAWFPLINRRISSAGIGFAPNGMRTLDLIEPGFRPLYEKICVGNKGEDAQWIFFENMLLDEGFGT